MKSLTFFITRFSFISLKSIPLYELHDPVKGEKRSEGVRGGGEEGEAREKY